MQAPWMQLLANCCSSTGGSAQCIAFARSFGSMLHVEMSFGHKNKVNKGSGTSYGSVKPAKWDTSNIHPASCGSHTRPCPQRKRPQSH